MLSDEQNHKPTVDAGDAFARELRDRKPSPYAKLLMSLPKGRKVSLYSDSMSFDAYVDAYFQAAKRLSAEASSGVMPNYIGLSILHLYRHFVELVLKACVDQLGILVGECDKSKEFRFKEVHSLASLLDDLRERHEQAILCLKSLKLPSLESLKLPSKQAQDFITELVDFDDRSQKTRYPYRKGGSQPAIDEDLSFSLEALDAGMLHVYKELKSYSDAVGIITGLYQDYKENIAP
jgi:hypothetical protein